MDRLHLFLSYLNHFWRAGNEHSVQAPFLFELYTHVIQAEKTYYCFEEIEKLRAALYKDHSVVASSIDGMDTKQRDATVSKIAHRSLSEQKSSILQFKLIEYFKPSAIIEIGTSLGINSLYLSKANPNARLYTLEGNSGVAAKAKEVFFKAKVLNIELIEGNFDQTLPLLLEKIGTADYVFFDGNHTYEATLRYFNLCLTQRSPASLFVFHDIYWSKEMTKAWEYIKVQAEATLTVDLFWAGLVFFKPGLSKQNISLKF